MPIILLSAAVAVALAVLFPGTQIGKALARLVIEAPVRMLNAWTPGKMMVALIALAGLVAMIAAARIFRDGAVVAWAAPDSLAWLFAFDSATYLEAAAAVWLVAASVRLRGLYQAMRSAAARGRRWASRGVHLIGQGAALRLRGRSRRIRPPTRRPPRDADEDRTVPAFAFA